MSASAGNGVAVTASGINGNPVAFDAKVSGGNCQRFVVSNRSSSSGNCLVNIPGLHQPGEYIGLAPGVSLPFGNGNLHVNGINTVNIISDLTCTIDFGVLIRV